MFSILLSSRWLGFHKGLKVAAYRTRFETQERAQREIFCCIETYGRTSEPFVAKKLSVRGTYSPRRIAPNKVGTPDNLLLRGVGVFNSRARPSGRLSFAVWRTEHLRSRC